MTPGRVERGVGHPRLAGERAGVGDRRGLRLVAPPDLDGHDRLAQLERPIGERQEPLGPLEPLDEQDDRARLGVVEAVGEVVADVEDDLRAAADDPREADPVPGMDERVADRARLGDPGDAAPWQVRRDVADVRRAVGDQVDDAHAVRARRARARAGGRSGRPRACIAAAASPPSTTPPPGMMTAGTPAAAAASVTERGTQRVERHDRDVGPLRERLERSGSTAGRGARRTSG